MALSVRDLGIECVAHLGEENTIDGALPAGARAYLLNCINRGLEEMRVTAPMLFKQTLGLNWTPAATGTINATNGSATVTMGTLAAPDDGCTVSIAGDSSLNEIRASATEDGTFLLLHPFSGESGTVSCTAYGDSVLLDADIDSVIGAHLLHERRQLDIVTNREDWMRYSTLNSYRDYGIGQATRDLVRQPGIPRAVWIESFCDPEGDAIRYRARCAPLPNGNYRATLEVLPVVREAQDEDFNDGSDAYLPVPGKRSHTIFRPLVMYKWSGSPWFKNASAREVIATEYKAALAQLENMRANAAAPFMVVIRP